MDETLTNRLLEAVARFSEARLNELSPAARERVQALFQAGGSIELRVNPMAAKPVRLALLDRDGNEFSELGSLSDPTN